MKRKRNRCGTRKHSRKHYIGKARRNVPITKRETVGYHAIPGGRVRLVVVYRGTEKRYNVFRDEGKVSRTIYAGSSLVAAYRAFERGRLRNRPRMVLPGRG